jgi:hypothetical protein
MSPAIRGITVALLAVTAALLAAGVLFERALLVPGLLLAATEVVVWLWSRPRAFVLGGGALRLEYPVRTWAVPLQDVASVRAFEVESFRSEFGFPLRVGVGGLWGGFGWLWTTRRGWVDFAISRTDGLLLVERHRGRPLLITPERPEEFLRRCTLRPSP